MNRFNRWRKAGHWARLLDAVSKAYDGDIQMIDSSSIRVHQHGGNAKKDGRSSCMGRSHGALTTRIHAMVDANGFPVTLRLGAGQAYDGHSAFDRLDSLKPGSILLADRAYDADKLRAAIAAKGPRPISPPCPGAGTNRPSLRSSTNIETWLNAFLANSNTSVPLQPDMTNAMTTISPPCNSPQCVSGCNLMSR